MRKSAALVLAVIVGLGLYAPAPAAGADGVPRNLILISIDTLRPDYLSCYGGEKLATPAIDGLAKRGTLFTHAIAHNPVTLPSHVNMLTGLTPPSHGVHDNLGFRLDGEILTLAGHLKAQGFRTAAFVAAFPLDSRFGLDRGFDLYDDLYGETKRSTDFYFVERKGEEVVARASAWLSAAKGGDSRWFLFLHLFDPHQPYAPPTPYAERYSGDPYAGEIAYVDDCLARLLGVLKGEGLLDRTLIVFTSDHGESLGEHGEQTHGYFAYNSTLHVPLIVSRPGPVQGKRIEDFVSHIDIFPTACDLLGIKLAPGLEGRSLRPLLEGRSLDSRPIYFESLSAYYNRNWAPLRGLIEAGRKFIDQPLPELYDLASDFQEAKDLATSANVGALKKSMAEFLERYKTGPQTASSPRPESARTREALRSLGYVGGSSAGKKKSFGPGDDLKTLLPLHLQLMEAADSQTKGDTAEAIQLLEDLLERKEDFTAAYEYLADIHLQSGEREKALEVLGRGAARSPDHALIKGRFGILLGEAGRLDEANAEIEGALKINPADAELWNYLGVVHWKAGRWDEAERCYVRALELDRNYAGALNNLGSLALSRKDADKALSYFEQALAFDSSLAAAHNGKAVALGMKGRFEDAVISWTRALEIEPGMSMALYNLGVALVQLNRFDEAIPHLERYLRLLPADSPDRERVGRLVVNLKSRNR